MGLRGYESNPSLCITPQKLVLATHFGYFDEYHQICSSATLRMI